MPKVTKKSSAPASRTARTSKAKTQPAAASNGNGEATEAKRAAREAQSAEQRQYVIEHYLDGDEKLSAVAQHLKITSGKAAFLAMQVQVERGEVPAISAKTDAGLVTAIAQARAKADEHSSWGWLAARSGKSEGWIKSELEKAGKYSPRAENVASKRAAAKPATKPAAKSSAKGKGKKVRGNA